MQSTIFFYFTQTCRLNTIQNYNLYLLLDGCETTIFTFREEQKMTGFNEKNRTKEKNAQ